LALSAVVICMTLVEHVAAEYGKDVGPAGGIKWRATPRRDSGWRRGRDTVAGALPGRY
jgi:hypothetical protein